MRGYRLLLHLPPEEGGRRKIGNGGRVETRERERETLRALIENTTFSDCRARWA